MKRPLLLAVLDELHHRHPARAEFALDGVAVGEGSGESIDAHRFTFASNSLTQFST